MLYNWSIYEVDMEYSFTDKGYGDDRLSFMKSADDVSTLETPVSGESLFSADVRFWIGLGKSIKRSIIIDGVEYDELDGIIAKVICTYAPVGTRVWIEGWHTGYWTYVEILENLGTGGWRLKALKRVPKLVPYKLIYLYPHRGRFVSFTTGDYYAYEDNTPDPYFTYWYVRGTIANYEPKITTFTVPSKIRKTIPFQITWAGFDKDGDSLTYELFRRKNSGGYSRIYRGSNLSYTDTLDTSCNTVAYRIRAYDGQEYSVYKTSTTITVDTNSKPTIPSITAILNDTNISVSWTQSTDVDDDPITYHLERSINGGNYTEIYSGTSRSYPDTVLTAWETVRYRVRAYDSYEYSNYSTSNLIEVQLFPKLAVNYNGSLKYTVEGWVNYNGQLRKITDIWIKTSENTLVKL